MVCAKSPRAFLLHCHSDKIARRKKRIVTKMKPSNMSVRFDHEDSRIHSHFDSTWLSSREYGSIHREVDLTLVLSEQTPDDEKDTLSPRFCSRGLEDYCYSETISTRTMATCLKPEVLLRRRLVIRAVLEEQEAQRRRGLQQRKGTMNYDHEALRHACLLRRNRENVMWAVERGLNDAERARAVYAEDSVRSKPKRDNESSSEEK
jgi:hypothetical protein